MAWRVESLAERGRYVSWGSDGLAADDRSLDVLGVLVDVGAAVPETATGPVHTIGGLDDELGVWLLAIHGDDVVPGPRKLAGKPPAGTQVEIPAGATP